MSAKQGSDEVLWVDSSKKIKFEILEEAGYVVSVFNETQDCMDYVFKHEDHSKIRGIITSSMRSGGRKEKGYLDGLQMLNMIFRYIWKAKYRAITAIVTSSMSKKEAILNNVDIFVSSQYTVKSVRSTVQIEMIEKIKSTVNQNNDEGEEEKKSEEGTVNLKQLLVDWGLSVYAKSLIEDEGYDQIDDWKHITDEELENMKFKTGHKKRFLRNVNQYFELEKQSQQVSGSTSYI